jgi:hypothetical protein
LDHLIKQNNIISQIESKGWAGLDMCKWCQIIGWSRKDINENL